MQKVLHTLVTHNILPAAGASTAVGASSAAGDGSAADTAGACCTAGASTGSVHLGKQVYFQWCHT